MWERKGWEQSPGEIKRREVSWTLTKKLAQKRSRAERWFWAKERVGLLLLQLFPKGGATDTVFVTLSVLHNGRDSNCVVLWSLRNAGRTLPQYPVVLAAVHGSLGLPGWRLFRGFTPLSPFSHSAPSLIGLLASVDVKQQKLSHTLRTATSTFAPLLSSEKFSVTGRQRYFYPMSCREPDTGT